MEQLNIKLHYQVINHEKHNHKIILESYNNKDFELTILDNESLNTIYSFIFNNIHNDKELSEKVHSHINDFYKNF